MKALISRVLIAALFAATAAAQQGGRSGRQGGPPPTGQAGAQFDLTGSWVSMVSEDWRWRMVTPAKGDYAGVPLNAEGRRAADAWDLASETRTVSSAGLSGAGGSCGCRHARGFPGPTR